MSPEAASRLHPALRLALEQESAVRRHDLIRVLVKVSQEIDGASLAAAGLRPGARLGDVLTGMIELSAIERLVESRGVLYVEAAAPWGSGAGGSAAL